jgi:hypothetical protein
MVIELVLLKVKESIDDRDFLRAADAATQVLLRCAGFMRRRLAKGDAREWVDYVEWQSLEEALAAARRFNEAPETHDFNKAIGSGSVVTHHLTVRAAAN